MTLGNVCDVGKTEAISGQQPERGRYTGHHTQSDFVALDIMQMQSCEYVIVYFNIEFLDIMPLAGTDSDNV